MESDRFDQWTRGIDLQISRRGLRAVVAGSVAALWAGADAGAKKKRKKKKTKGCTPPYFDCNGECRLSGACCDGRPGYDCAETHANEPGRWVCCTYAGFGCYDLDSDRLNCGACGQACTGSEICCHGLCQAAFCVN